LIDQFSKPNCPITNYPITKLPNYQMQLSPLYVVCDVDVCARAGWAPGDFASACLEGGARLFQLRAKNASGRIFLESAIEIVRKVHSAGGVVIVNDRADIAKLAHAGGVHVGQDDLSASAVREMLGPDAIVGLSTHSPGQIDAARKEPLDYVAIGPVFETATKQTGYDAIGLDGVRAAAASAAIGNLPLVAIGGITLERAESVRRAGADSVTVISDLLATGDPASRVRAFLDCLSGGIR
jgi:thiamine-phosphate pyrophosphorylase